MASPPPTAGKPRGRRQDAEAVVRTLRAAGHQALLAGGCVRDMLLGLEPTDWDVATDAPPDRVQHLFANTQAVGAAFGVILVRIGRSVVEVATFRAESDYADGRRPSQVHFTSAQEDAQRRDFTINGLFLDPLTNQVIDYVGGEQDIRDRLIRAIGRPEDRFAEDHLRMLRAVRFAARLDFHLDPATAAAIGRHAPRLARISPERIAEELRMTLTPPTRAAAWRMLWDLGLLAVIFRSLPCAPPAALQAHRSVFLALKPSEPVPFGQALAAAAICRGWHGQQDLLVHVTGKAPRAAARAMRHALRISNEEMEQLEGTLEGLGLALDESALATVAAKKRFLSRPTWRLSVELLAAIDAATGQFHDRIALVRRELTELEQTDFAPPPLITGEDLIAAGLQPGPLFKKVLADVYDAQLEGAVRTREEAMAMVRDSCEL